MLYVPGNEEACQVFFSKENTEKLNLNCIGNTGFKGKVVDGFVYIDLVVNY